MSDFKAAWAALPPKLQDEVKADIMKSCFLESESQFDNRRNGTVRIREYEMKQIIIAFQKHDIDAITGHLIDEPQKAVS